jgi:hypothetical protein
MTGELDQKVLYIGGFGRSGSTLVERILGQLPGFCSSGEVVFIWQRGLIDGQLCGCGVPVPECEFWSRVGKTAFGGWDQIDAHEMLALQKRIDRNRYIPSMAAPRLRPQARADFERYTDVLSRLYRGIGEVAGARVVIDASKHASTAFLLRRVPGIDLRVVHLVRDSRGVAYSWTKEVLKPEVTGGDDAFMPQYSPSSSGRQWVAYNLMFDALGAIDALHLGDTPTPRMLLRYEALMANPREGLERILAHAGEPVTPESFAFLGEGYVDLGCDHTVAGNPMRFHQGRLDLRLDQAWTTKLPERDRKVVTAITWPLQVRYGYSKKDSK